ncbi:MAG: hypothetical protein IT269_00550 [Saprospiraceae bacterium]|nr:hypothetical protein [Saprospiraceae bacterium]
MTWVWMSALLVATTGVSIHQIYCYCIGETTLSLFNASHGCKKDLASTEDCCQKTTKSDNASCCSVENKRDGDCTRKTTQFVQLKTEFLAEKWSSPELTSAIVDDATLLPPFTFNAADAESTLAILPVFPKPPPLSGRMICVRHCIALC